MKIMPSVDASRMTVPDNTIVEDPNLSVKTVISLAKYQSMAREASSRRSMSPEKDNADDQDAMELQSDGGDSLPAPAWAAGARDVKAGSAVNVDAGAWLAKLAPRVPSAHGHAALKQILVKMSHDSRLAVTPAGEVFRDGEDCGILLGDDVASLARAMTSTAGRSSLPESMKHTLRLLRLWRVSPSRWRRGEPDSSAGTKMKKKKRKKTDENDGVPAAVAGGENIPPAKAKPWYLI